MWLAALCDMTVANFGCIMYSHKMLLLPSPDRFISHSLDCALYIYLCEAIDCAL